MNQKGKTTKQLPLQVHQLYMNHLECVMATEVNRIILQYITNPWQENAMIRSLILVTSSTYSKSFPIERLFCRDMESYFSLLDAFGHLQKDRGYLFPVQEKVTVIQKARERQKFLLCKESTYVAEFSVSVEQCRLLAQEESLSPYITSFFITQ